MASAPHASERSSVYPGTCKGVVIEDDAHTALRFAVPDRICEVEDHWSGSVSQDLLREVGDFVVRRKDGVFAYHLAVVVDDAKQGVTEVVRGRDLLSSTPRQVALFEALGETPPRFAHLPLWVDSSGHRLAKRRGDSTIRSLLQRESPESVLGRVGAVLGVCEPGEGLFLDSLLQRMDDDMGRLESVGG